MAAVNPFSLPAYYAELYAIEDRWHDEQNRAGCIPFDSAWPSHLAVVREIDARHGVTENDSRVYSIAAYKAEIEALHSAYVKECREKGYDKPGLSEAEVSAWLSVDLRYGKRQNHCNARHFPGLTDKLATANTNAKLWMLVERRRDVHEMISRHRPTAENEERRGAASYPGLEELHRHLRAVKFPCAYKPPYPDFTPGELTAFYHDVLQWLEEEEAARSRQHAPVNFSAGALPSADQNPRHSSDFSFVHWFGADHRFTGTQAAIVKMLWEAWEKKTPSLRGDTLLSETSSEQKRLADVFKSNGKAHEAWGTMIVQVPDRKGLYQLEEAAAEPRNKTQRPSRKKKSSPRKTPR